MDDIIKSRGASASYKDDRGGAVLIPSAVLGIVKNNIDPTRSGKIQVFLKRLGSNDPDNPAYWTTVSYLSPFFGTTANTASSDGYGDYVGNPNSYGFWATPPDINTEVVCVFLNGDPNFGYYIGSIPKPGLNYMVPAIGSSDNIVPNEGEAQSYGGATRLPVTEINNANSKQDNNATLSYQPRPIHSYQAGILFKQGLLRDPDRGVISSSAQRESPSRVFGMSTPGRPIYQGGYDDTSIGDAVKDTNIPDKNFKIIGRRGGHSFVMDDGDLLGRDQLLRLRTATGHTILMNDAAQTLFIIHANGQSYIELGKEGTIDMFSTNSVNIRTQGDLNLHADNNVNIQANKDINMSAVNIKMETDKDMTQLVNGNFKNQTKGNYTSKTEGGISLDAKGPASLASADNSFVNGKNVNLNTGATSVKAEEVKPLSITAHSDTISDPTKGYVSVEGQLSSIVSRAPAHAPWDAAGKGVDVKVDSAPASATPSAPTAAAAAATNATPTAPKVPTSPALASTVPPIPAASNLLDKTTTSTMVSQMAVNAASGPAAAAVAAGSGVVQQSGEKVASLGVLGMTPSQLVKTGHLKPGTDAAINGMINSGKSIEQAMSPSFFTGKDGINSVSAFCKRTDIQAAAGSTLLGDSQNSLTKLGVLTGNDSLNNAGGLIMSGAVAGPQATAAYAKSLAGGMTNLPLDADPTKLTNGLNGSIPNLMAGGAMAASMSKKVMGLGDPAAMLNDATSKFKAMVPGVPQNLTEIAKADSASTVVEAAKSQATGSPNILSPAATATLSKAFGSVQSGTVPGVSDFNSGTAGGFISGAAGLYAFAKKTGESLPPVSQTPAIPDSATLQGNLNPSTSLAGFGSLSAATKAVKDAIAKVTAGGPVDIKLPSFGEGTFNVGALQATAKKLVGNPKVPALPGTTAAPAPGPDPSYSQKLKELQDANDEATAKREQYEEFKSKYGTSDPKTDAAFQSFKIAQKKAEALSDQLG